MIRFLLAALPGRVSGILTSLCTVAGVLGCMQVAAQSTPEEVKERADTGLKIIPVREHVFDSVPTVMASADGYRLKNNKELPFSYLGQFLNGQVPGINLMRSSGEPGVAPLVLLRGLTQPIGSSADIYGNQPLYVVNGIPILSNDHPYALGIKQYEAAGAGSGIDMRSLVDLNNVKEIKVIKGAEAVALYGPQAANGVIQITTPDPVIGRYRVQVNAYGGIALRPSVNTKHGLQIVNGAYQRDLILPSYEKYATPANWAGLPTYLMDSTQSVYFGAADWDKRYYSNTLQHGVGMNISGGNQRANFRFGVGERTETGVADETSLKRYNVYYDMFMVPVEKLLFKAFVQGAIGRRDRNRYMLERFAEQEYFPDQQLPLSPNAQFLQGYYEKLGQGFDNNSATSLQMQIDVQYELIKNLFLHSRFSIDYNDNNRELFVPASLNDGNSFNSYFTGVNRRVILNNYVQYARTFSNGHRAKIEVGQTVQNDQLKYDYIKGFRGPSDFIKIIQVQTADPATWLTHDKSLVYTYKDYMKQSLVSFYGHLNYDIADKYSASLSLRSDGSSFFGNGYYWSVSPVLALSWDLKKENWLQSSNTFQALSLSLSGGRTTRQPSMDYYGYGPYLLVDIGYNRNEKVSGYASIPTLNLPFSRGYVGGDIKTPYADQLDVRAEAAAFGFLQAGVNFYTKTNRNMLMQIPSDAAYGYSSTTLNGMEVRNTGVEISLQGNFKPSADLTWTSGLIFQYNSNKLLRLPGGLTAINYGNRRLQVGKSIDQFWLLQNEGIYNTESEVPVSGTGKTLTYNGLPFKAGDAKWKDVNNDYVIDDNDRVMQGHAVAPLKGAWNNTLQYRNWSLDLSFQYALNNQLLNGMAANRLNFAKREGANGPAGVKELNFWSARTDLSKYPRYNPWSLTDSYQAEQNLFLESARYLKLQSAVIRYDLTSLPTIRKAKINKLQLYLTASNLFTLSPYSGQDPSMVDFYGYDYGYAMPLPLTFSFGVNVEF